MNSKNKHSIDDTSSIDDFLFDLAKKDYTPIPEDIHNNIIKTINNLETDKTYTNKPKIKKHNKISFKNRFRTGTVITRPTRAIIIAFLAIIIITTGVVGARNISEKIFNKDTIRLDNIGISNEFIFTEDMETALRQNVPLNLIQLNDNYYIHVHSVLLDEINFFTVFELHSKSGVTDDLRFIIKDLKITDENGEELYCSNDELNIDTNNGYNHIYNRENSIKELFFMFGNDSSRIKELNYTFSNIEVYRYNTKLNEESNFKDITIACEEQNIKIPITKDNYNTIQEYVLDNETITKDFDINKVLYTNLGLYLLAESQIDGLNPIIITNNNFYMPSYEIPLKRAKDNKVLMLYAFNMKNINDNTIEFINYPYKEKYKLIPKN